MIKIYNKTSKMMKDPETVWGKNPELEQFWRDLASGKKVVLIYKDKTHKIVNLPNKTTKKYKSLLKEFEEDNNIIALLSSSQSQDAYELNLYPKAKTKSVDYVIKHYNTYFKPLFQGEKLRVPI